MPIDIPKEPKVFTSVYDNFKGVDFTNDSTNVWHRRSPDGYNMLPDDSGRPFKRKGWEVVVTSEDLGGFFTPPIEDVNILKCHYFELAGIDHVLIFADCGVFKFTRDAETLEDNLELLSGSTDVDCYGSYDRAFFFEGGGTSAFYIYGNYKVWVYGYEDGFYFKEADNIHIPRVLVSTNPSDCVGTELEGFNMLGDLAMVEYTDNDMFYSFTNSETFTFTIDKPKLDAWMYATTYTFKYDSANTKWVKTVNAQGTITTEDVSTADFTSVYGVTVSGTPANNDEIIFRRLVSDFYTVTTSSIITYTLDSALVDTWLVNPSPLPTPNPNSTFTFTYDGADWDLDVDHLGSVVTFPNVDISLYGITLLGTPSSQDEIVLKYLYGILLPSNVTQDQVAKMKVYRSVLTQFDDGSMTIEEMYDSSSPPQNVYPSDDSECVLHTDLVSYPETGRRSWIEFYSYYPSLVSEEDSLRVVYPVTNVTVVNYEKTDNVIYSGNALINS